MAGDARNLLTVEQEGSFLLEIDWIGVNDT